MLTTASLFFALAVAPPPSPASTDDPQVIWLTQEHFRHGTYLIDQPGLYRLAHDISFNPNSRATLQALCNDDPTALPHDFECPADAYQSGMPLRTQWLTETGIAFVPGGPSDPRYHPAAFGLGFFAAIAISADNVTLDLNGHTLEQSEEHALLQRFFAVIELANQPFVPGQGPSDFGPALDPARQVRIVNGTIGRSAHHGVHGNANERVHIENVNFEDFEVAAVALNGVDDALVRHVRARNRLDVPVLGVYSAGQFIRPYLDYLARTGAALELNGVPLDAVRQRLRESLNRVHHDLIVTRHLHDGRPQIDATAHPAEFALFANPHGVVDGNAYGFLINPLGVAVNGFPFQSDSPARNVTFDDVHIDGQVGAVTEVVALATPEGVAVDPVGAVFQTRNRAPDGRRLTINDAGDYTGNVVADAQAVVAKAIHAGLFEGAPLNVTRNAISTEVLAWVEGDSLPDPNDANRFVCNGDSMFHVNKGVIGFKMDGVEDLVMRATSIRGLSNVGQAGSDLCGDYLHNGDGLSHPAATLPGYGGAHTRGYTFAGSKDVLLEHTKMLQSQAYTGDSIGVEVLTDSQNVVIRDMQLRQLHAGVALPEPLLPPNRLPSAVGVRIGPTAANINVSRLCVGALAAPDMTQAVLDQSGGANINDLCP
ncbi:MAG: hypothetical protein AB8G16_00350 [Gammaproteobacteria bacterium]